jgi:hypothetical protein
MERGARMVLEMRAETGESRGAVPRVAQQMGVPPEALRLYVRQTEIDAGQRAGIANGDAARIGSWSGRSASCAGRLPSCARPNIDLDVDAGVS